MKNFWLNYWKIIILVLVSLSLLSGAVYYYYNSNNIKEDPKVEEISFNTEEEKEETPITNYFYIDIKGAINNPGIYQIEEGKRVFDAIELAGGLKDYADTSVNNLSMKVFDEMVIIIYSYDEVKSFTDTKEKEAKLEEECKTYLGITNDSCTCNDLNSSNETNKLININTALESALQSLPGIGEAKAKAIIAYRDTNGLFTKIEDIKNVPGIGDSIYEQIKDYLTI